MSADRLSNKKQLKAGKFSHLMQLAKGHQRGRLAKSTGSTKAISAIGVVALSLGVGTDSVQAQATSIRTGNSVDIGASALAGELTTSKVVKDPGAPYENVFRDVGLGLNGQPKIGPGNANVSLGAFNFSPYFGSPIDRGFRPEEAELKLGNFYLDIRDLTGSFLYSDNANLSEANRESDVAAAVTLGLTAMFHLNEGLRVAVSGSVIYLPLSNEIGVSGFGLADPFAQFALDGGSLAHAQIVYDFTLGHWDVVVYDDFNVLNRTAAYLGEAASLDLYDGESFNNNETFRSRRVFSTSQNTSPQFNNRRASTGSFQFDAIDYRNLAGVSASRYLPADLKDTIGYEHGNYWYSNNSLRTSLVARPRSTDRFYTEVVSERENLRFKPYAGYAASTSDRLRGWDQVLYGGVFGPITDQLDFQGEAGYVFSGNSDRESTIWRVGLLHWAGPYTVQSIRYSRSLVQPDRVLETTLEYTIDQVLGPYLTGRIRAARSEYEDLDVGNSLVVDQSVGGQLVYDLDHFGNIVFFGQFRDINFENPASADYTLLTLQLSYGTRLGEHTSSRFFYQFEKRDSTQVGDSYYENLVGLSLTYSF